jgi:hypothetical protein
LRRWNHMAILEGLGAQGVDSWRINCVRHLQLHEYACIYCTHMQASIAHICLHRLHTHASHITAVVPQRVYRHGLQIETHTRVPVHPVSSHACASRVVACMYTQCHRVNHACGMRCVSAGRGNGQVVCCVRSIQS